MYKVQEPTNRPTINNRTGTKRSKREKEVLTKRERAKKK